ncbi:MAG: hypothetical protein QHH19_01540 [Candidatus Thermoplasmatota archaeon]|jgi:hypothetical protein|nr:hypothetical protein [Candidatus Thermoplasmatota archaeon]
MIGFEKKGMLAPFTILTSIFTGVCFPLLGSFVALDLGVVQSLYLEGVVLVVLGGFFAQWIFAHTIHDIYHMKIDERITFSKKTLKILFVFSLVVLLLIAVYLTWQRGWPVFVFSIIGAVVSMYAEGLLHHESQMAFGAMFLVIGSFYVQAGTLYLDYMIWVQVLCMAVFAFLSQYGWLLFYRLDDYGYDQGKKNKSILVAKSALIFLILYLIL